MPYIDWMGKSDVVDTYNGIAPIFTWDNGLNVEFKSRYPKQKDEKLGEKDLRKDLEIGVLQRVGGAKGGHWLIK